MDTKNKMSKADLVASRMNRGYSSASSAAPVVTAVPVPSSSPAVSVPVPAPESQCQVQHTGKRGRPKGSCTRKEEYRRVGFEAKVSLLEQFDKVATKKGLMRREAFEAALQCFIVNK